jgi:hypothetical protein
LSDAEEIKVLVGISPLYDLAGTIDIQLPAKTDKDRI